MQSVFRESEYGRNRADAAYDEGYNTGYKKGYIWGACAVCLGIAISFGLPALWTLIF